MQKLLACCHKELIILLRDKTGLTLLFLLPLTFLLIITLIQANSTHEWQQDKLIILLLDQSDSGIADNLQDQTSPQQLFSLQQSLDGQPIKEQQAREMIAQGKYPAFIIISTAFDNYIDTAFKQQLASVAEKPFDEPIITLVFDPNVNAAVQYAIENTLQLLIQQAQLSASAQVISEVLTTEFEPPPLPNTLIHTEFAHADNPTIQPNAVQQNVPAWAIFGMFFIALPIAGGLFYERTSGVIARTLMTPISPYTLLLGKIITFSTVNLLQLTLMLLMGVTVLPWLGLATLHFGTHPYLIPVIGLATALATTGFGIMLGALTKTHEQVSIVSAMSIVIAAAIGGIMVPLYLMPEIFQKLAWLSPLRWSHDAFISIFVRGGDLFTLLPQLLLLVLFSLFTLLVATQFLLKTNK